MNDSQKTILFFAAALVAGVFIWLDNKGTFFGGFINQLFPCAQNPDNSFPCYGVYDLGAISIALIVGVLSLSAALYYLIRRMIKKNNS